jgi:hypothetical protein
LRRHVGVAPRYHRAMTAPSTLTERAPLAAARTFLRPGADTTKRRWRMAFAVAAVADVLQIAVFPAFVEGAASPLDDALDAVVAVALLLILGLRFRLAFALALELVPGADLFPTWTAVVASVKVEPPASAQLPS